jgi:hypothetical protein
MLPDDLASFGLDWNCTAVPKSVPICVKMPSH